MNLMFTTPEGVSPFDLDYDGPIRVVIPTSDSDCEECQYRIVARLSAANRLFDVIDTDNELVDSEAGFGSPLIPADWELVDREDNYQLRLMIVQAFTAMHAIYIHLNEGL